MTDPKINSSSLKFRQELIKTAQSLNLCALALANPQIVRQAPQEPRPDLPAGLDYLNKNADVRANPDLIHPGTKCIICAAMAYKLHPKEDNETYPQTSGRISAYACGRDYHKVLKKKLTALGNFLRNYLWKNRPDFPNLSSFISGHVHDELKPTSLVPNQNQEHLSTPELFSDATQITFRAIADSAPFPERFVATATGMAQEGKNGLCAISGAGSAIFLGELLVNIDLISLLQENNEIGTEQAPTEKEGEKPTHVQADPKPKNSNPEHVIRYVSEPISYALYPTTNTLTSEPLPPSVSATCPKSCSRCFKACPTQALSAQGFKAERCLSYLTIESDEDIPFEFWRALGTRVYGCDACQEGCLRCQNQKITLDPDFKNRFSATQLDFLQLINLNASEFTTLFAGTPIMHAGYRRFMRNVFTAATNTTPSLELVQALNSRRADFKEYEDTINRAISLIKSKLSN